MENELPVSIVMTAYNREHYICDAISSVLKSDFENLELIIVDDCSTDNTVIIIKEWAAKDRRIKYFVNEKNLGQFENRNRAIGLAVGEFIVTADSDDMIYPYTISYLLDSMKQFPESSFGTFCPDIKNNECLSATDAIHHHFFKSPILMQGPGATIFKRNYFHLIEGYTNEYGVPGDMYFNLKAAAASPVVLMTREFMYYRRHEGQEINNKCSYLINNYRYMRDALSKIEMHLTRKEKAWLGKKNKRRFSVNIIKDFIANKSLSKTAEVIRATNFSFKDFLIGIIH